MKVDTAIILAGGLGTRLRSVIFDVPKPMAPVGNKPFLHYLMTYWYQQGIRRFVLSTGYLSEKIIQYFGNQFLDAEIIYSHESQPLGTGGGLLNALSKIDTQNRILLLNGDTYFEVDLKSLQQIKADIVFSVFESDDNQRYMPISVHENGLVDLNYINMSEFPFFVNGGVYLIKPSIFEQYAQQPLHKISLENEIFGELNKQCDFKAKSFQSRFIDIGIPEDYQKFKLWKL